MTQPAQQQQPSNAQVTAIAALLAGSASLGAIAAGVSTLTGLPLAAATALLRMDVSERPAVVGVLGPAARQVAAAESVYRALYLANAAQRVQRRVDGGMTVNDAIAAELPAYRQHLAAQANRAQTANAVDKAAARHGLVLGWRAVMDSRTSAECRAANGRNFDIRLRPRIGFPGSVHPHCRCRPVGAFAGAGFVDDVATQVERKVAVA